jgi:hypothetical protein
MQPNTQEAPAYFVWQPQGKPYAVHISLDVVDRLNADVMRGFGAVPKRGAEVGGVLLGSIERGETNLVRIDDFEIVPCEYGRGPSFYLSGAEQEFLASVAANERAVGFYRSHTRDGAISLGTEDLDWLHRFFADQCQVALLVKPFATKVNTAGFFVREDGAFPAETALEFPFRRREMLGEEAPARRSMQERKPRNRERREQNYEQAPDDYAYDPAPEQPANQEESFDPRPRKQRSTWVWLPLAVIFLALGMALGYQLTVTFLPNVRSNEGPAAFALNLSATRSGESISLRWNREAPAVLSARRGVLEIEDGEISNSIPLDAAHLKEGTVVYQNSTPMVHFRLVIYVSANTTVNETVEWEQ